MSQQPFRVEADGTRVYAKGMRYRPKTLAERKYAVRKPEDPRAFRWRGEWFLPLEFLPEEEREMPATYPWHQRLSKRNPARP